MEAKAPKVPLATLLNDFLEPIIPEPAVLAVLRSSMDENVRAQELAPLINSSPEYRTYVFNQSFPSKRLAEWESESKESRGKEAPHLQRILGSLATTPIRNFIAR